MGTGVRDVPPLLFPTISYPSLRFRPLCYDYPTRFHQALTYLLSRFHERRSDCGAQIARACFRTSFAIGLKDSGAAVADQTIADAAVSPGEAPDITLRMGRHWRILVHAAHRAGRHDGLLP